MSLPDAAALFVVMTLLAAMPSASVALVVVRSATAGLANGIAVAMGIVLGDLLYLLLAVAGLAAMAGTMGSLFAVIKFLGGIYLLWLGFGLLRGKAGGLATSASPPATGRWLASLAAGFLLTLGDVKAILFYASLLPLFIEPQHLQSHAVVALVFITLVSVGGVKLAYAMLAHRVVARARRRGYGRAARKLAGGMMLGAGGWLLIRA